jgi:hypothetical protein
MDCGSLLPASKGAVASTVRAARCGTTKGLQAICIVSAMTFTGSLQVSGNSFGATAPDATLGAGVSTETPGSRALSAAVPRPICRTRNSAWLGVRPSFRNAGCKSRNRRLLFLPPP